MYMRYYDSYPALSVRQEKENAKIKEIEKNEEKEDIIEIQDEIPSMVASKGGFLNSVKADDIILIALLFILLSESDDIIMLLIIGYLLLGDKLPI